MELNGWKNVSTVLKYATSSMERQENMSDILALNNIQYRNPLASLVGRNKPAVEYQGASNVQHGPLAEITNSQPALLAPKQLALPPSQPPALPPPPAPQEDENKQLHIASTENKSSYANPQSSNPQNDLSGIFQGTHFSGNPNITINYHCISNTQAQVPIASGSQGMSRALKRIRRPMIDSDSDSD